MREDNCEECPGQLITLFFLLFVSSLLFVKKKEHVREHVRLKDRSGEHYKFRIRIHFYEVRPITTAIATL